jgi:hypothetical protein
MSALYDVFHDKRRQLALVRVKNNSDSSSDFNKETIMRIILLSLLLSSYAFAASPSDAPPPLPAKESEAKVQDEPEIKVIEKSDATIAEYRLKGKLYMMKVTPKVGKPYFLIDREGQGRFDRSDDLGGSNLSVPRWVIFEF